MAEGTELAKAYVQIVPSAKGIKGSISNVMGGEADSAGKSAGESIASKIKTAIKAAGIGLAIKSAISEGADLEQSFQGGLDTLYGDAADMAREYAKAAAEAGISASSYAEQAVSFGAALKQSLGGDAVAAAEAANTAILDMADNSAKMGTDISSIQNAYQGFAKQNYTMLDNLKLGYGGTKEEMQRLLEDAEELSGVEYDMSNLSDVYSAIHVIQENLGLTGVAADEASSTISGSFGAMKAAAENFMGYLVIGEDIQPALDNLMSTVSNFLFNNLIPAVGNIFSTVPGVVASVISDGLPQVLNLGVEMVDSISEGLKSGDLTATITGIIENLGATFTEFFPRLIESGLGLLEALLEGIGDPSELINTITDVVGNIIETIGTNLPQIIATGIELIVKLALGLIQGIPHIIESIPEIIIEIVKAFAEYDWGSLGRNIIDGIKDGVVSFAGNLVDSVKSAAKAALDGVKSLLGIQSPSKVFRDQVGKMIDRGLAEGISGNTGVVDAAIKDLENSTFTKMDFNYGMPSGRVYDSASVNGQLFEDQTDAFMQMGTQIVSAIKNMDMTMGLDGVTFARLMHNHSKSEDSRRGPSAINV